MAEALGTGVQTLWTSGGPDLDPFFRRVSGGMAVAHAVARRFVTPQGRLSWAPGVGFDVTALLGDGLTSARANVIATYLRREARADDRVADAVVNFQLEPATSSVRITIQITTSTAERFDLVLSASKLTAAILAIEKVT